MKLPKNEIGISDILAWMDCGRRMSFSMKRWEEEGEPPEAAIQHAYGSCIHDVLSEIERGVVDDDTAIQFAFDKWGWALGPEELERLKTDIATYRTREVVGVKTVLNEGEIRVPLMERDGEMIYFRGRIDRLYQFKANPSVFLHVDYKSSAWRKTEKEVHEDKQLWAYNWAIHEYFPEVDRLIQRYDQLNFGYETTEKSPVKRKQIAEWLRRQVSAILNDEEFGDDGLLIPRFNDWCPWCPIMESCDVVPQLTDFAQRRIALLSPHAAQVAKVGLDATGIETYVNRLDSVGTASKVLDKYEKAVKDLIRTLPTSEQALLGWIVSPRRSDQWDEQAMREAHDILGDDFYRLVGLTKSKLDSLFDDDPRADQVRALAERRVTGEQMRRRKSD